MYSRRFLRAGSLVLAGVFTLAACGQKGPLTLPEPADAKPLSTAEAVPESANSEPATE